MDHQSFRLYIPGIIFLLPIYFVICYFIIHYYNDPIIREFVLIGGITVFPAIALPIGWFVYNIYRVVWLKITHGYEDKDFSMIIKNHLSLIYVPKLNKIVVNISNLLKNKSSIIFNIETFRKSFYPFNLKRTFYKEFNISKLKIQFSEHLSDIVFFNENSYDYARSISSIRYSLESSVFSYVLGSIYAILIYFIWLFLILDSIFWFYLTLFTLIILSFILIVILYIRWKFSTNEYDARLNLISVINSNDTKYLESIQNGIPEEIIKEINGIQYDNNICVFDLDNTLIDGDIGEAVLATLIKRNLVNYSWEEYLSLVKLDVKNAYIKTINLMKGLQKKIIEEITLDLINSDEDYIIIENFNIKIPKPNFIMQDIISYLNIKSFDVNVITASNQLSAEILCWHFFGIPFHKVFGGRIETSNNGRIEGLQNDLPFNNIKVGVLKSITNENPIIGAGDSNWDMPMLKQVAKDGIILWLGKDELISKKLKKDVFSNQKFFKI